MTTARQWLERSPLMFELARASHHAVTGSARWVRWRLKRPQLPPDGALRLHLGCGPIDRPGFVNIDARPAPHVHRVQRIDRLPDFADATAELVYCCHCLEHVSHRDTLRVLQEWRRVLKPGGVLRLSVPDFDLIVDAYTAHGRDIDSVLQALMGGQDYDFNFHYSAFTERSLSALLVEAGFRAPRRWQHGTEPYTSLPDWSGRDVEYRGARFPISLNLEATR